jgi:hypothetical protein
MRYRTDNDLLRRHYEAITSSIDLRIDYDPSRKQPYVAYVNNRAILDAPYIGAAVEAVARYVLTSASRRRASGAISRQAHGKRATVKANALFGHSARRYNALKRLDAMTTLNGLAEARKRLYSTIMREGIVTP